MEKICKLCKNKYKTIHGFSMCPKCFVKEFPKHLKGEDNGR